MAANSNKQHKQRTWLYLHQNGMSLVETGMGKDKLPYLKVIATQSADNPLQSAARHAAWVRSFTKGQIDILLANSLFQLLLSDVPDVPADELQSAIELKAADLIAYDIDDALIDVIQLPAEAYRGRMKMAYIIAMQKQPVRDWLSELVKVGIRVGIIDVETTALRNLSVFHQNVSNSGILHLQTNQSRLILFYAEEMVLSRPIDIGLSRLITETTVQDGELELTVDEEPQDNIQLETLVLEVRRSFDYYESQLGLGSISELQFLCDEQHESLAQSIADRLGVRCTMIRTNDFMHIQTTDEQEPSSYYGIAGTVYREALS